MTVSFYRLWLVNIVINDVPLRSLYTVGIAAILKSVRILKSVSYAFTSEIYVMSLVCKIIVTTKLLYTKISPLIFKGSE